MIIAGVNYLMSVLPILAISGLRDSMKYCQKLNRTEIKNRVVERPIGSYPPGCVVGTTENDQVVFVRRSAQKHGLEN